MSDSDYVVVSIDKSQMSELLQITQELLATSRETLRTVELQMELMKQATKPSRHGDRCGCAVCQRFMETR